MYKGDTIQELVAAVDAIRERRSGNAVERAGSLTAARWSTLTPSAFSAPIAECPSQAAFAASVANASSMRSTRCGISWSRRRRT